MHFYYCVPVFLENEGNGRSCTHPCLSIAPHCVSNDTVCIIVAELHGHSSTTFSLDWISHPHTETPTIPFRYSSTFSQPTTSKGTASLTCLTQPTGPCSYDRLRYLLPRVAQVSIQLPRNRRLHGNHHAVFGSPQRSNPNLRASDYRRLVAHRRRRNVGGLGDVRRPL